MAYLDQLLADPVYLALMMAAFSLVVSLTTGLYIVAIMRGAGGASSFHGCPVMPSGNFDRGFSGGVRGAAVLLREVSDSEGRTGDESAVLETRLHFSGNDGNDDKGQRFV